MKVALSYCTVLLMSNEEHHGRTSRSRGKMGASSRLWGMLPFIAILILAFLSACAGRKALGPALRSSLVPAGELQERLRSTRNGYQKYEATTSQKLQTAFYQLPLSFIPNRGQVDERVRFYGRSGPVSLFFAQDEMIYAFVQHRREGSLRKVSRSIPEEDSNSQREGRGRRHVVRLQFVGANQAPVIEGQQELPGKVNYFIGSDPAQWKRGLPTYEQVRYRELWPGIDLIYRGQKDQLKYEFVIRPGADPSRIRLAYRGIEGLTLTDAGDLILKTASGELRDSRPIAYQEIEGKRVAVAAGFQIEGRGPHRVGTTQSAAFAHGFEVKGYNPAYPLILDPGLGYSTFLGGSSSDLGEGITVDAVGDVYVTGKTWSSDFPTIAGVFDTSLEGTSDAFVAKLSSDGSTLLYSTFLGGSGLDRGSGIALDAAGNAFVTGETSSSDFPITAGAFDTDFNGGDNDAFVAKLSSDGSTLLYSTFLGGSDKDNGGGIAVDAAGNAYIMGETFSSDFPTTAGAFDTSFNSLSSATPDAFVVKFSSDGSQLLYATFLGGSGWDTGSGIALDATDNAFVTGWSWSSDFPTTAGAFDTSHNGSSDGFVAKLSSDGSTLLYSTFLGGSNVDWSRRIALDASGNAYVTGVTGSSDFPTTAGAFDTSYNGSDDVFVAKLSSNGSTLLYSTFLGGSVRDWGIGIALDASGNAYVTGVTGSSDFPTTAGAFDTSYNGSDDVFVVKLNNNGSILLYSTFLGGSSSDWGRRIAVDAAGNAYVTGYTFSSDFPTTAGTFDTSYNDSWDVLVAKLSPSGPPLLTPPTLTLTLTGCTQCRAGDQFTVQAHVTNPRSQEVRVEAKMGVRLPDGTTVNLLGNKHLEAMLPAGLDTTFPLLDTPLPAGLPTGTWAVEGTLLGPDLGETFSREVKPFDVVP